MTKLTYEERKKLKEEKRQKQAQAHKRKKLTNIFMWGGFALLVAGFIFWAISASVPSRDDLAGEFHAVQGAEHITPGSEPPYQHSTNPPTSGWHYDSTLGAGFYETEQRFGDIVHSLEHGAIAIYYNPENITEEETEQLRQWYQNHRRNNRLMVVPLSDMDTNYALTAWTWIDKFNDYDESRIEVFIGDHLDKWGPESGGPIGSGGH